MLKVLIRCMETPTKFSSAPSQKYHLFLKQTHAAPTAILQTKSSGHEKSVSCTISEKKEGENKINGSQIW